MHLDFKYEYDYEYNGGYTITGYRGNKTNIIIPDEIMGKPVKKIGKNAFNNNRNITSVTLGKNVDNIGAYAFEGCYSLGTVYWNHSGYSSIDSGAFLNCRKLRLICINSYIFTSVDELHKSDVKFEDYKYSKSNAVNSDIALRSTIKPGYDSFEGCSSFK